MVALDDLLSVTLHSECFTCAGWPVNEYCAILSIEECLAQLVSVTCFKCFTLCSLGIQNFFKGVVLDCSILF